MIAVWNEGHCNDLGFERPTALGKQYPRSPQCVGALNVGHGNRRFENRGETATGHPTCPAAIIIHHDGTLADRLTTGHRQPDTEEVRPMVEFGEDPTATGKAAFDAPTLRYCESQTGLNRRGTFVQIVAIQRKTGLKTQRIARAKPHRLDLRLSDQKIRNFP